ncbi:hypothetical protein EIC00_24735 [Vibrio parahaemolyticus]|nr:hypothetical protein [Vibrio parahaemolyticus]
MIEYLKLVVDLVGHLAWPIVVAGALLYFKKDVAKLLQRVKKAKYGDIEIDLVEAIDEVKGDAIELGITIAYPSSSFSASDLELVQTAPEWAFLQSWQNIENILITKGADGKRQPITKIVRQLQSSEKIDSGLADLILKMYRLRNEIVHVSGIDLTKAEAMEWLGVSKSVSDRLVQKLA